MPDLSIENYIALAEKTEALGELPAAEPFVSPQILHGLPWD